MITFWIIYILGVIATLWTYYYNLESGDEVSLSELLAIIIASLLSSWFAFVILLILIYGNKTVFKKK